MNYYHIIIIILILIMIFIIMMPIDPYYGKIETYSNIKSKLKSGDILFFTCHHHNKIFDKIQYYCRTNFANTEIGHVALIIRKGDRLFALECTNVKHCADKYAYYYSYHGGNPRKEGIRIIDLDILLKKYYKAFKGSYGVRCISQEIPNEIIFKNVEKYKNMVFDSPTGIAFLAFIDLIISHNLASKLSKKIGNNRIICSEFVHRLLYDCGVMKEYPSKIFWPHFYNSKDFKKFTNVAYSDIIKFVY